MIETTVRGLIHVEIKEATDLPDLDISLFAGATDAYVKVNPTVFTSYSVPMKQFH